ncbi:PAS domain S-box protein [Methanofollis formosanus]|uniref:histidine kinase n=1 Tax=Methanofollis formosanus TaxID=299308 RepID=A0A8G1EGU5_9EURY|nr:PAS domain S-box protein [Methanofollis formosanus]QYZ79544.1 PAS domain S-box protein [Methanofollis formosanus]
METIQKGASVLIVGKSPRPRTEEAPVTIVPGPDEALAELDRQRYEVVIAPLEETGPDFFEQVLRSETPPDLLVVPSEGDRSVVVETRPGGGMAGGTGEMVRAALQAYEGRRAGEALKERERQLTTLMANLPGMVYRCKNDLAYTMEFVSEGSGEVLGYTPEDLVMNRRVSYGDLIREEDRDYVWEEIQSAVQRGTAFRVTYRVTTADGSERWVWEQGRGVMGPDGSLVALEGFITDITARVTAEKELKRREVVQKAILDNIPDYAWLKDREGRYIAVNRAFEELAGRRREEIVGHTDREVWPAHLAERYREEDREVMASGIRRFLVEPLRRADGLETWVETVKTPITGPDGTIVGTTGIGRDVTKRMAMEDALRRSEEKYRVFLENFQGIAFRATPALSPAHIFGDVEGMTGYTAETFLSGEMDWREVVHPDDRKAFETFVTDLLAKHGAGALDFKIVRKDGTLRWVHEQIQTILDAQGEPAALQGSLYDITARKVAEEKARDLAKFPEESPEPILRVRGDGTVLYANPASRPLMDLWGIREGGMVPEELWTFVRESFGAGEGRQRDFQIDGSDYSVTCVPVPEGEYANLYATDITERKAMETAVHEANRKLNLLNSVLRHDLLNQLTVLQGYLELARQSGEAGEYLEKIAGASERIRRQVDFTRDYQELGVKGPIWQGVREEIENAFAALSPSDLALTIEVPPDLEVLADPLLERVFYNLLDNSIRHGRGASKARVHVVPAGDGVTIVYEDNGVGIPEGQKDQVFRYGAGHGTGLGLFLSREVLALTGLAIVENGREGEGARFEIRVPVGRFWYREEA